MAYILETENLSKSYFRKKALINVNLKIESGKIVGLLGPNGSGKTTLLKLLAGLIRPSSGTFKVCGLPYGIETKRLVSFLPDRNIVYPWMKAIDTINFYEDFFPDFDKKKALEMLKFMKLEEGMLVKEMSKGMVEKLNLTLNFSRNAKLFILDEPIGGADPVSRERIIKTVIANWAEDCTLLISTHLVTDVESILSDVIFLKEGEVILQGDAEDLRVERGKSINNIFIDIFREV